MVIAPLPAVKDNPPLPAWIVVVEVVFVEPRVVVLTPAPVAKFKVEVVASVPIEVVPVPALAVRFPFVAVRVIPPDPDVIPTDVAPVAFPKVFTLAPVVARFVAPKDVKVVVVVSDPGAIIAEGSVKVIVEPA